MFKMERKKIKVCQFLLLSTSTWASKLYNFWNTKKVDKKIVYKILSWRNKMINEIKYVRRLCPPFLMDVAPLDLAWNSALRLRRFWIVPSSPGGYREALVGVSESGFHKKWFSKTLQGQFFSLNYFFSSFWYTFICKNISNIFKV